MNRYYLYKMTVDNGGAPCVYGGVLTLAICKPAIRRTAKAGDFVLGFAANGIAGWRPQEHYSMNRLVYIARIGSNLPGQDYYSSRWHSLRPDCVYSWDGRTYDFRRSAKFHSRDDMERDLGSPADAYRNARVLMSCEFRYFEKPGPSPHSSGFSVLSAAIENLARGTRVNHRPGLAEEIKSFAEEAWKRNDCAAPPVPKRHCDDRCDQDEEAIECVFIGGAF